MKNIIFSRRNLDFNIVNLAIFSMILELAGSFRTRLHMSSSQTTSHMSSNETHMRFGERWRRTAMLDRVSTLITGGVHIDHPHTTNIAGNSKWFWKFKIIIFCLIWDLKWENEVYRWSKIDEKNRCHEKKSSFPKIISYDPYGDQIWVPNSSPARRYLQKRKSFFFRKKKLSSE